MLILWIVLAILVVLAVVLAILPIGVDASYIDGKPMLRTRLGPIQLWRFSSGKKKKPEKTKQKEPEKAPSGILTKIKNSILRGLTLPDVSDLARIALNTVSGAFRRMRVDLFMFHIVIGDPDPAEAAILYGTLCGLLSSFTPLAHRALRLGKTDVKTALDFDLTAPVWEGRIVVSLHFWRFLFLLLRTGFALRRWQKSREKRMKAAGAAAADREESAERRPLEDGNS